MRFEISREYTYLTPLPGMFQEEVTDIELRTVSDPLENEHIGAAWYEVGTNHRTIVNALPSQPKDYPWIARDRRCTHWFIEVESLDALVALAGKHFDVLVERSRNNHERWAIEIGHECD